MEEGNPDLLDIPHEFVHGPRFPIQVRHYSSAYTHLFLAVWIAWMK